jgi:hypothetical protein
MAIPPRHVPTETLVDGLRIAAERLGTARNASAPTAFYAVFEALAWVGSVRDRLKEERRVIPPTLNGLYYVRNLVLHQGADVLLRIEGVYGSAVLGEAVLGQMVLGSAGRRESRYVFPGLGDLPAGQSRAGHVEYSTHVANRNVNYVLATAITEVEGLKDSVS